MTYQTLLLSSLPCRSVQGTFWFTLVYSRIRPVDMVRNSLLLSLGDYALIKVSKATHRLDRRNSNQLKIYLISDMDGSVDSLIVDRGNLYR